MCQGLLNLLNLLGNDRQHFNINTIKLVKASPSTGTLHEIEKEKPNDIDEHLKRDINNKNKFKWIDELLEGLFFLGQLLILKNKKKLDYDKMQNYK